MSLSSRLREARLQKGLKQEEVANALGKTKSVISRWEKGENRPDADSIFDLSELLDVNPNWLLEWEERYNPELTIKERSFLAKYRALSDYQKETVDILVDRLFGDPDAALELE